MNSIFYCDIEGTFRSSKDISSSYRNQELKYFANILDELCESSGNDNIYFSFVSSDEIEEIKKCIEEFSPFVENSKHIKFGTSFSPDHKIIGNNHKNHMNNHSHSKQEQIIHNIEHITKDDLYQIRANIDRVYFADDCAINHKILNYVYDKCINQIEKINFMPGQETTSPTFVGAEKTGLLGLIKSIKKYIEIQGSQNK